MPAVAANALADRLCDLVRGLTANRRGSGPHWVAVSTVWRELQRAKVKVLPADLDAAIAICVERRTMKAEGTPPHSISVVEAWEV